MGRRVGIAAGLAGGARRPRGGRAPGRDVGRRVRGRGRGGARGLGGVLAGRRLHGADRAWVVGPRAIGRRGQHRRVVVGPARVGAPRGIEHLTPRLPRRPDDAEGDPDGEQGDDQGARDRQAAPPSPGPDRGGHREARRIADRAAATCLEGGERLDGRRVTTGGGAPARRRARYDWPVCDWRPRRPPRGWRRRRPPLDWRARRLQRRLRRRCPPRGWRRRPWMASRDRSRPPASRRSGRRSRQGHVAPCGARARFGTVVQPARLRSSR